MRSIVTLSALSILLVSFTSAAVTLDYRHEYKSGSQTNADRLKLSHTTPENYFFSVEGKLIESSQKQSDGYREGNGHYSGNGSEWEMGRSFKMNDSLTLAPAVNLDIGDTFVGYRAQIKAIYRINDSWLTTFRWRPGMQVDEKSSVETKSYQQFNWEFGYTSSSFTIVGDYEYRFTDYSDYQGNEHYWLYNVVASVPVDKHWTPYTEIGTVPRYNANPGQGDREMRYRLGVRYNI